MWLMDGGLPEAAHRQDCVRIIGVRHGVEQGMVGRPSGACAPKTTPMVNA